MLFHGVDTYARSRRIPRITLSIVTDPEKRVRMRSRTSMERTTERT